MGAYVNSGTRAQGSAVQSISPTLPGSLVTGNLLILQMGKDAQVTGFSFSGSGWVAYTAENGFGVVPFRVDIYYRFVDGSETAPTVNWNESVNAFAQIHQFSGVDATTIFGAYASSQGATSTHSVSAITTTADASRALYLDSTFGSNTGLGTPSGWTEDLDNGSATGNNHNTVGGKDVATSGSSSGAISVTGGASAWSLILMELLPKAGVTLTGIAATGSAGSLGVSFSLALTGTATTAGRGTLLPAATIALLGTGTTGPPGSLSATASRALTGAAATGSAGTATPAASIGTTGAPASGAAGSLGVTFSGAATGVSATGAAGSLTPAASFSLTGTVATGSAGPLGITISLPLTGIAATGSSGTLTPVSGVVVALTGLAAASAAGSVALAFSVAGSGALGTTALGSVSASTSFSLTGVSTATSGGSLSAAVGVLLSGLASIGATGTLVSSGGSPVVTVLPDGVLIYVRLPDTSLFVPQVSSDIIINRYTRKGTI